MPPRRSVGRNATATPARATRANSAIPVEGSETRRSARAVTQQPRAPNVGGLREVELQQSYGYGSKAAIREIDRLDANKRTLKGTTAGEIDADIEQAKDRFQSHAVQALGNLGNSPPASRIRRRTSKELSRDPSTGPEQTQTDKEAIVAAWAESLESDQLEGIPEEDSPESEAREDRSRQDTDPSSFPSGFFDASYNFERGQRKPPPLAARTERGQKPPALADWTKQRPRRISQVQYRSKNVAAAVQEKLGLFVHTVLDWLHRTIQAISKAILEIPESRAFDIGVKGLFVACCLGGISFVFCLVYSKLLCNPYSTSIVSQNLQKLCGTCTAAESVPTLDLSGAQQQDISRVSSNMQKLQKQIQLLESRLAQRFDSQQAVLQTEVEALRREQIEMSSHLSNLQIQQSPFSGEGIASPLLPKINFFAPSNGALVDPKNTSPTKAKPQWLVKRVFMRALMIKQTVSKDPTTALEPWHDVGDCWCAATPDKGDYVRLHVTTHEYIYPTELVVEHFPLAGTRDPGTAPRRLELWADFSEMDKEEQDRLQISKMQENNVFRTQFARLGMMHYDASLGVNHVQSFKLDVNQQGLAHYAKAFVLRVTSTYGADNACLYRVRLHGVPTVVHASAGEGAEDYFQRQGYKPEGDS